MTMPTMTTMVKVLEIWRLARKLRGHLGPALADGGRAACEVLGRYVPPAGDRPEPSEREQFWSAAGVREGMGAPPLGEVPATEDERRAYEEGRALGALANEAMTTFVERVGDSFDCRLAAR
jgi:hypothetical protein